MNLTSYSTYRPRENGQFIAAKVTDAVRDGILEWAGNVLDTAQGLVPVDTGELRASGQVTVAENGKTVSAAVSFDADHAGFVEFGTGVRGASSSGAGEYPYSPGWVGMPAQPYLRPAFEQHRQEAIQMTREKVAIAID